MGLKIPFLLMYQYLHSICRYNQPAVVHICKVNDPLLFKDFDRNRLPCKDMRTELDLRRAIRRKLNIGIR